MAVRLANPLLDSARPRNERLPYPKRAIQDWAHQYFPEAFRALPAVETLSFTLMDDKAAKSSSIYWPEGTRTVLLFLGTYVCQRTKTTMDYVYAFLHGKRLNSIGLLREGRDTDTYKLLDVSSTGELCEIEFCRPFHDIIDKKAFSMTVARLKALTCYYYMCAGYIERVGGYQTYARHFYMACAWIAGRGLQPTTSYCDLEHHPVDCSDEGEVARDEPYDKPSERYRSTTLSSNLMTNRATSVEDRSTSAQTNTTTAIAPALSLLGHRFLAQSNENEKTLLNLTELVTNARDECYRVMEGNKRLKLDIQAISDKDTDCRVANDTLTRENLRLRNELKTEKERSRKLRKDRDHWSSEAEKRAKATKFETELSKEKAAGQNLQKKLDVVRAELLRKEKGIADEVAKEMARADAAEAKLSGILAVFGKTT